ncbi:9366_t:CDS:2, partial [Acaulospora morrowiae]
ISYEINEAFYQVESNHQLFDFVAHIFEKITVFALLFSGASIAFHGGKSSNVLADAEEVKPTIFTCTPKFMTRFTTDIQSAYGKQLLFGRGYCSKLQSLKKGQLIKNSLWDMLVFNRVKAKL